MIIIKFNIRITVYTVLIMIFISIGTIGFILNHSRKTYTPEPPRPEGSIVIEDNNSKNSKYELLAHIYSDDCTYDACKKLVIIKTSSPNAKTLLVKDYAGYILIYDGTIKLVDIKEKKIEELDINYSPKYTYSLNLENESEVITENIGKKVDNIKYYDTTNIGFYDYKTKKHSFNTYKNVELVNDYYLALNENDEKILLNRKAEELFKITDDINLDTINRITTDNNYIYLELGTDKTTFLTYDKTGKQISKITDYFTSIIPKDNLIYAYGYQKVTVYNINGKIQSTKNLKDYEIKYSYEPFIIGVKNNNLVALNISTNKETNIINLENKTINEIKYDDKGEHNTSSKNKKGIYILLQDNEYKKYEIFYNIETNVVENYNL